MFLMSAQQLSYGSSTAGAASSLAKRARKQIEELFAEIRAKAEREKSPQLEASEASCYD
jgi:hypothetical protein